MIERGSGGPAVAQSIKDFLEGNGIPCLLKTDSGIAAAPLGMPTPAWTVLVGEDDADRARELLKSDAQEAFDPSEYDSLRYGVRQQTERLRRETGSEPPPSLVIGVVAGILFLAGLVVLTQSAPGLGMLLFALGAFAGIVALKSR
ncbi:MAG: DUF2007 domain-containing protein [Actinomycetota bacterium]